MIVHVWKRASRVSNADSVVVATDDRRIASVVSNAGGTAVMTSSEHTSGTSRVWEAASRMDCGIVVNVQGDEPLLPVSAVERLIELMRSDRTIVMATLAAVVEDFEDLRSPHVVKVVCDREGNALYFSRSPIPFPGFSLAASISQAGGSHECDRKFRAHRHIGVYAFRRDFLRRFVSFPQGPLEKLESLEQLRALENGYRIKVLSCRCNSIGVDRPEDLKRIELAMRARRQPRAK